MTTLSSQLLRPFAGGLWSHRKQRPVLDAVQRHGPAAVGEHAGLGHADGAVLGGGGGVLNIELHKKLSSSEIHAPSWEGGSLLKCRQTPARLLSHRARGMKQHTNKKMANTSRRFQWNISIACEWGWGYLKKKVIHSTIRTCVCAKKIERPGISVKP